MLKKNAVKFTAKACLKAFKISCYKNTAQCRPICQFNTMPRIIISASVNLTMYCRSIKGSLMAVTLIPFCRQALRTRRPMRPNLHKHTAELFKMFHNETICLVSVTLKDASHSPVSVCLQGTWWKIPLKDCVISLGETREYLHVFIKICQHMKGKVNNWCLSVDIWLVGHTAWKTIQQECVYVLVWMEA